MNGLCRGEACTVAADRTIRVWELRTQQQVCTLCCTERFGPCGSLCYSPQV